MIELFVTAQGLSVQHAMYAVVLTEARERVQVVAGAAHPPTYVAADAAWGLYDDGRHPGRDLAAWLEAVYGQGAGTLLPLRRVNVVDAGAGITIFSATDGPVKLRVRPVNGGALQEFTWAGPADYSVDGLVDLNDLIAFLNAWSAGRADFDGDGVSTGLDVASYLAVWQNGGLPACQADVNRDGRVDVFDLTMYIDWWNRADIRAEIEGVSPGVVDVFDMMTFVGLWTEGC